MEGMIVTPVQELTILFGSIAFGMLGGAIYDILRRIKLYLGKKTLLLGIGDVLSSVALAIIAYIGIYILNDGEVRWYEVFGIFGGFTLYMLYLSEYVIKVICIIETGIKKAAHIIIVLISPVKKLSVFAKKVIIKGFFYVKKGFLIIFKRKKNIFRKI